MKQGDQKLRTSRPGVSAIWSKRLLTCMAADSGMASAIAGSSSPDGGAVSSWACASAPPIGASSAATTGSWSPFGCCCGVCG